MELPIEYEQNMRTLLKDEFADYAACLDQPMHHGIRVNTRKISAGDFQKISPLHLTPVPWCPNGFYYDEHKDKPSKHPYYHAGLYYIQEPSAMTPAGMLPVTPGDRVLDLCAAPGGKSTELFAKLSGCGLLVSNDVSASRAKALLKNLEVFGADNCLITSEPPYRLAERFPEYFDRILIDAPCSGEGMFRKSSSMITAWERNGNRMFADLQREILKCAVLMLKPGGSLLYSTCTFSPLEDEQSVEYLLSLDNRLSIAQLPVYPGFDHGHPEWGTNDDARLSGCVRLWPHKIEGEGHFVCLVNKEGESFSNYGDYPIRHTKLPETAAEFLSHIRRVFDENRFEISGDKLYYIPDSFPAVRGLRILRCGLYMGEIKKNRFEPSQALAMALTRSEYDNCMNLSAEDDRVVRYLKGETIDCGDLAVENGYVLVCVDGYPLGFGKANRGVLKNKYLPGWRLMS